MIPESVMRDFPKHNVRSVISTVKVILKYTALACKVIDLVSDIDPCKIAVRYLVNALGSNAVSGKYIVKQHHQPGYIPGCEPRHSLYCNSGHTEYVLKGLMIKMLEKYEKDVEKFCFATSFLDCSIIKFWNFRAMTVIYVCATLIFDGVLLYNKLKKRKVTKSHNFTKLIHINYT